MKDYACYINPKKGTDFKIVELSEAHEEHRVMLDCTDIFVEGIFPGNKIKLSDKKGIPLFCECPEDIYIYFDKFVEMVDESQQEELKEWFFNSEWVEYYLDAGIRLGFLTEIEINDQPPR